MGKDLRSDGSGLESLVFPSASTALEPRFLSVQWVENDSHACTRTQMELAAQSLSWGAGNSLARTEPEGHTALLWLPHLHSVGQETQVRE